VEHFCAADDADAVFPTAEALTLRLRDAGRYREALAWIERILDAHPSGSQKGLALFYQVQLLRHAGSLASEGAEKLGEALILVGKEGAGWILHELGEFCRTLGRLQEASSYFQRALKAKEEIQGEESTDVATSLHSLAGVLQAQGDLTGAREKLERSLHIYAAVFGTEQHPSVAASLHELARVLQAQGDLAGAREKLERSLHISAAVFGTEQHPDVAASLHELAGVLQAQGDLAGARETYERVLEIFAKVYGTRDHYMTAITEASLGFLLLELDEKEAAVELLAHAYAVFQRQLGPEHPYTRQLASLFEKKDE
jgi:tetratricopeptide (TPR) repeat protein